MNSDTEILFGLSTGELEALANGMLSASLQGRMDMLIALSKQGSLSREDEAELDRLLMQTDQLTLVKTRAAYTLRQQQAGVAGT